MTDNPIDMDVFADLEDTAGTEFALELVTTFLQEAPPMMVDLKEAASMQDADRFRRAAHSIKSNATTFGALHLAGAARAFELGGLETASVARFASLDAEYDRATHALRALLDE